MRLLPADESLFTLECFDVGIDPQLNLKIGSDLKVGDTMQYYLLYLRMLKILY